MVKMMQFQHELLGQYRAQFIDESGRLWVTNGYNVCYSDDLGMQFSFRARLDAGRLRNFLGQWSLATRLTRAGFLHLRPLEDGSILGVVYGGIVRCEAESDMFAPVLQRPGRTMKLAVLPGGEIFAGEYFYNKQRDPVHILRSGDGGRTWRGAYEFRPGEIRHIHSLNFDKRSNSILILTGDSDSESKVLLTNERFELIRVLLEGTQRSRALAILPTGGGYFIATDTPYEQNYIQFLSFDGVLSLRCPIAGSSLSGCQVGEWSFFATAAEPSSVNRDPSVTLYGACNGQPWHVIDRWRADRWSWPSRLQAAAFQMGRLIMPAGENGTGYLFGTPIAVLKHDGILHRWRLR